MIREANLSVIIPYVTIFISYHHIPPVPCLDCEIVDQRYSHVRVRLEAESEDRNTNEEHRDNSHSLQTH